MKMMATVTVVLGLLLASTAHADKDDSYYIAGTGNPNRNEKMYWKDAENVFQDLSSFSTLYVEFHNCAWTWMQTSDDDNDIDENDYWYMGKIPPMGANVAYSLYGSLKGDTFSGCGADTFINSFYTNTGFTNFARAMNYAGLSGFSKYSYDDDSSSSYTAACSGGSGVGCDYSNGFAVHTYSGDECNPSNYTGVSDSLSNLNSAMKSATCIKIFDSSSYSGSPYGTPLEVLAYSHSCFYQDFFSPDGVCPDPYGKLQYYQEKFYNGIQESKKQDPYQISRRKQEYYDDIKEGKMMSVVGLFLVAVCLISSFVELVMWCCCTKSKPVVQKELPAGPQQDVILTKRSGDDDDTDTDAGGSKSTAEGYITMSDDVEAPATTYQPPIDVTPPSKEDQANVVDKVKQALPAHTARAIESYVMDGIKTTQSLPPPITPPAEEVVVAEPDTAAQAKSVDAVDDLKATVKSADAMDDLKASVSPETAAAIEKFVAGGNNAMSAGPGKEVQADVEGEAAPVTVYAPPGLESDEPKGTETQSTPETEASDDKVIASRDEDEDITIEVAPCEGNISVEVSQSKDELPPILEQTQSQLLMAFEPEITPKRDSISVPDLDLPKPSLLELSKSQLMSKYFDAEEGPSEVFKTDDEETTEEKESPALEPTTEEEVVSAGAETRAIDAAPNTVEQTPSSPEEAAAAEEADATEEEQATTTTVEQPATTEEQPDTTIEGQVEEQATATTDDAANISEEQGGQDGSSTRPNRQRQPSWFGW
ncbi:expressed unknown protein [Seminavis robusta]|uniref:Uncharacterized protein n=1 Tax=Seminavis robusta TaxID=568900 RepID=A0A9N8HKF7_9STRA|nr:expressed unknown protein [Seminavis robusta]|eukprot:Sro753_g197380.1 n/a (763) ;mRNA; f:24246-26534